MLELISYKKINSRLDIAYTIYNYPPPPNYNNILTVVTSTNDMKEKKRIKTKVGVGSVVKVKVGEMEDTTREGRRRINRK